MDEVPVVLSRDSEPPPLAMQPAEQEQEQETAAGPENNSTRWAWLSPADLPPPMAWPETRTPASLPQPPTEGDSPSDDAAPPPTAPELPGVSLRAGDLPTDGAEPGTASPERAMVHAALSALGGLCAQRGRALPTLADLGPFHTHTCGSLRGEERDQPDGGAFICSDISESWETSAASSADADAELIADDPRSLLADMGVMVGQLDLQLRRQRERHERLQLEHSTTLGLPWTIKPACDRVPPPSLAEATPADAEPAQSPATGGDEITDGCYPPPLLSSVAVASAETQRPTQCRLPAPRRAFLPVQSRSGQTEREGRWPPEGFVPMWTTACNERGLPTEFGVSACEEPEVVSRDEGRGLAVQGFPRTEDELEANAEQAENVDVDEADRPSDDDDLPGQLQEQRQALLCFAACVEHKLANSATDGATPYTDAYETAFSDSGEDRDDASRAADARAWGAGGRSRSSSDASDDTPTRRAQDATRRLESEVEWLRWEVAEQETRHRQHVDRLSAEWADDRRVQLQALRDEHRASVESLVWHHERERELRRRQRASEAVVADLRREIAHLVEARSSADELVHRAHAEIARLHDTHTAEVLQLAELHAANVALLQDANKAVMTCAEAQAEFRLRLLREAHAEEVAALRAQLDQERARTEAAAAAHAADLALLDRDVQDLARAHEDAVAEAAHWRDVAQAARAADAQEMAGMAAANDALREHVAELGRAVDRRIAEIREASAEAIAMATAELAGKDHAAITASALSALRLFYEDEKRHLVAAHAAELEQVRANADDVVRVVQPQDPALSAIPPPPPEASAAEIERLVTGADSGQAAADSSDAAADSGHAAADSSHAAAADVERSRPDRVSHHVVGKMLLLIDRDDPQAPPMIARNVLLLLANSTAIEARRGGGATPPGSDGADDALAPAAAAPDATESEAAPGPVAAFEATAGPSDVVPSEAASCEAELRKARFAKRKQNLIKKAMELSILEGCEIGLTIIDADTNRYDYTSGVMYEFKLPLCRRPLESVTNADYFSLLCPENEDSAEHAGDAQDAANLIADEEKEQSPAVVEGTRSSRVNSPSLDGGSRNDGGPITVMREGHLHRKPSLAAGWAREFYVLQSDHRCIIFADENSRSEPAAAIELANATVYAHVEKKGIERPLFFNVRTETCDFLLRADDQADKDAWVKALKSQCFRALRDEPTHRLGTTGRFIGRALTRSASKSPPATPAEDQHQAQPNNEGAVVGPSPPALPAAGDESVTGALAASAPPIVEAAKQEAPESGIVEAEESNAATSHPDVAVASLQASALVPSATPDELAPSRPKLASELASGSASEAAVQADGTAATSADAAADGAATDAAETGGDGLAALKAEKLQLLRDVAAQLAEFEREQAELNRKSAEANVLGREAQLALLAGLPGSQAEVGANSANVCERTDISGYSDAPYSQYMSVPPDTLSGIAQMGEHQAIHVRLSLMKQFISRASHRFASVLHELRQLSVEAESSPVRHRCDTTAAQGPSDAIDRAAIRDADRSMVVAALQEAAPRDSGRPTDAVNPNDAIENAHEPVHATQVARDALESEASAAGPGTPGTVVIIAPADAGVEEDDDDDWVRI